MSDEKDERAKQQAAAQLSSIREMVAALDRESAADLFVKDLTETHCINVLTDLAGEKLTGEESLEELRELVAQRITEESIDPDGFEFDEEEARQTIQEDALSVEMRSGWVSNREEMKPEEYNILLCTGGPACRIIGTLSEHGEPEDATLQYQDWGTPWTDYRMDSEEEADVVKYAQQFYFGE